MSDLKAKDKEDWINQFVTEIKRQIPDLEHEFAVNCANCAWVNLEGDLTECPIDSVNEEISCWTD